MTGRASGGIWRGAILLVPLLLVSCQTLRSYDSTARTIRLRAAPREAPCHQGAQAATCVVVLQQDWETLVIDYKAKCLQLGGSPEHCQTVLTPAP